ncbi:MAG: hypothetical protein H0U95_09645 [Bacteroidetes bacterium]|nr:hypothetical protein [Bacteroidota bacterium]
MSAFTIISETNSTQSTLKSLFDFLSDFKNFGSILPEDKVEDFKFTDTECSFNIKGITPMTIKKVEAKPHEFILFSSQGLAKFNFSLKVFFIGDSLQKGQCKIELMGDLNPFIKAMAEKPLTALTNSMSLKLSQLNLN